VAPSVTLAFGLRDCPVDFDWEPVISAGPPTDASIKAVNDHFASSCTAETSLPVTMSWFTLFPLPYEEGPSTDTLLTSTFVTKALPGTAFAFQKKNDPTLDFWAACSSDGVYDRRGSYYVDPVVNPTLVLKIPSDFAGDKISCMVYLNHAAGTITHVVHGCASAMALGCIPATIPADQFDEGAIWTSLPADSTAWGEDFHVYAGARWYLRNGFNRQWKTGTTAGGAQTLEGAIPRTTVEIGVGNVDNYKADSITVYCGSEATGWDLIPVVPIDDKTPTIQWGDGMVPVGVNGAPNHVTCHWFVFVDLLGAP